MICGADAGDSGATHDGGSGPWHAHRATVPGHRPDDLAEKLVAASNQFSGTGLDVSIDEVAQAAGVPRATVYYYFSGRDDLVAFFLNHKLVPVMVAGLGAR